MILAEKILALRTAQGWSQEELAEKLEVSRQSVSKWESAASIPDINKILQLSQLFGVTTDYLLKDNLEGIEYTQEETDGTQRISLRQADEYLAARKITSVSVALGAAMCILSPTLLILLSGTAAQGWAMAAIGLPVLLAMVAAAVALFIFSGMKLSPYQDWEEGPLELEYGVKGIVEERLHAEEKAGTPKIALGVALCVLSPVPLVIGASVGTSDFIILALVDVLLALVAVATALFITAMPTRQGCNLLLRREEYTPAGMESRKVTDRVAGVYWPVVVAIYLAISLITRRWDMTWIIWPVAGVMFGGIAAALDKK